MKMKAAQISRPGGDFELVERAIPEPGARQVPEVGPAAREAQRGAEGPQGPHQPSPVPDLARGDRSG